MEEEAWGEVEEHRGGEMEEEAWEEEHRGGEMEDEA
ncbi:hypothetical protein CCACVL1_09243 [Corchorus capsularis]|uniref:Uncharacterized protein n=1 Tax=Corchorus capsularis TaxID=210143 RepID=A0A1R3IX25_COCAP|nr:hypothetical protein CCACVL1_09243 [Corchorus capsularis]